MRAPLSCLLLSLLLGGCGARPPVQHDKPAMDLPGAYRNTADAAQPGAAPPANTLWWQQYGNPELDGLIAQGLSNNSELKIATLQIAQARIRAKQARAGDLPTLTAPVQVVAQGSGGTVNTQQSSQFGLQATYRVDLWGEQGSLVDAADMQVLRAEYERDSVKRNLVYQLVSAYIGYLVIEESMQLAQDNQRATQSILESVEQRLALGDATLDEVEQQRATLATLQTATPMLENQLEDARTAISRLVGALPGSLNIHASGLAALDFPRVTAGVPASLIFSRPDIQAVEARMHAANANIALARARLLPPLDLAAQTGYSGLALSQLLQPQSFFWASAASIAATIFDGGRRQGEKDYAESYYAEMTETYRQTVFQAIREVESAISTLNTTQRRLDAQKRNSQAALHIFKTATDAFRLQAVDSMTLLESRKNYQRSSESVLQLKAELLRAHASLWHAMGGAGS